MSSTRVLLACLVGLLVAACSEPPQVSMPYSFLRPKHVEFVCFAPKSTDANTFDVLPRECCTDVAEQPIDLQKWKAKCPMDVTAGYGTLHMHALVSQTIRGEIAAVDLGADASERTLDSNRTVPGYTFIDSGGLPSALVVPSTHPFSTTVRGPQWVYVASAEQYEVRAIPTCVFRSGKRCGPELELEQELDDPAQLAARLKVVLPSAPGDMVLGPDKALWLTLPELGLLARIELAKPANDGEGPITDAFAIDPETNAPPLPQFFRVPTPAPVEPPTPIVESTVYQDICGLGIATSDDSLAAKLPLAPRADTSAAIRPMRLRHDEDSGFLLVADAQAPFIHAFSLDAQGTLTARGGLPTGAPIRDFTVTPTVPSTATLPPDTGGDAKLPILAPPDDLSTQTQRYLYAVDGRDGSLMAFDFAVDQGASAPRLTPLIAPTNDMRFADRLDAPQPITTLEVMDTRARSAQVCGAPPVEEPYDAELDQLVRDEATADSLRGVFLITAAARGSLGVMDIYDLNLACRDNKQCDPADRTKAKNPHDRVGVAIRRHTQRRRYAGNLEISLPDSKLLAEQTCGTEYVPWNNEMNPRACVSKDPWNMLTETWNADYLGPIPGTRSQSGVFEQTGDPNKLVLRAPGGLDFCGRGVLKDDVVALVHDDRLQLPAHCADLTNAESETFLSVIEAHRDRLVVGPGVVPGNAERFPRLLGCFPEFVPFEVRAGQFLVTGSSGVYIHNVVADADGQCVPNPDPAADIRLSARAKVGVQFANPYVTFTPATQAVDAAMHPQDIQSVTVQVLQGTLPLTGSVVRYQAGDALPAAIQYVPENGDLFVLDGASQGLLRYNLTPFERRNDN